MHVLAGGSFMRKYNFLNPGLPHEGAVYLHTGHMYLTSMFFVQDWCFQDPGFAFRKWSCVCA